LTMTRHRCNLKD